MIKRIFTVVLLFIGCKREAYRCEELAGWEWVPVFERYPFEQPRVHLPSIPIFFSEQGTWTSMYLLLFAKDTLYQCLKSFCGMCEEVAPSYDKNRFRYWTRKDTLFLTAYGLRCEQDSCWEESVLGMYRYTFQKVDSWDCGNEQVALDGRCRLYLEWIGGEEVLSFFVLDSIAVHAPFECYRGWCE